MNLHDDIHWVRCGRFLRSVLPRLALVAVFFCLIVMFLILHFGNPQSHKYIYIFQSYIFPRQLALPTGFTGVWTDWYRNGQKETDLRFSDEQPVDGKRIYWHRNGRKMSEYTVLNRKKEGVFSQWDENGNLIIFGIYQNGNKVNGTFCGGMSGLNGIIVDYYLKGEKVTRKQYLSAYAKDSSLPKPVVSYYNRTEDDAEIVRSQKH